MTHTKHLWRIAILLLLAGTAGIVGRHFLIPPTFGEVGFFRADALKEHMARPVIHGTRTSCNGCHEEVAKNTLAGKHAGLSCETCHAPESQHAKNGAKTADMPSRKTAAQCAFCHAKLRARPEAQHQIVFSEHLVKLGIAEPGDAIPEDVCYTCHDPHSPSLEGASNETPQSEPAPQQQSAPAAEPAPAPSEQPASAPSEQPQPAPAQ